MLPHQYYQYVGQLAGKISGKKLERSRSRMSSWPICFPRI